MYPIKTKRISLPQIELIKLIKTPPPSIKHSYMQSVVLSDFFDKTMSIANNFRNHRTHRMNLDVLHTLVDMLSYDVVVIALSVIFR